MRFPLQIGAAADLGILRYDDDLLRRDIRMGEPDLALPFVGDGDSGSGDVGLAGLHRRDDRVEAHIFDDELAAGFLGDGLHQIDVDADDFPAFAELVRRKRGFSHHHKSVVIPAAAGQSKHQQQSGRNGGDQFQFHEIPFHSIVLTT